MRFISILPVLLSFCVLSCSTGGSKQKEEPKEEVTYQPADKNATEATVRFYNNLFKLEDSGIMFGAQIPTEYGLDNNKHWYANGNTDNSDTKYLTGSHPAVCGWELSGIELDQEENIDGENFQEIRKHIIAAYSRGAVNTISWHCANPATGGNAWDKTRAVYTILEGGKNHEMFMGWLDKVADFIKSLKDINGEQIPIIFRPWHEHTGDGFWWSVNNCSTQEFVQLWQMVFKYMTEEKGLHDLLWGYSPDLHHFGAGNVYMNEWPGDEYVDILGLDAYDTEWSSFKTKASGVINYAIAQAKKKNKLFALTETGLENNNPEYSSRADKDWWTKVLYPVLEGRKISFILVWRNAGFPNENTHFFNAYRGCYSEEDFLKFTGKDDILLESDLPNLYR